MEGINIYHVVLTKNANEIIQLEISVIQSIDG